MARPSLVACTDARTDAAGQRATVKPQPIIRVDIASSAGLFAVICVVFAFIRVNSSFPTPTVQTDWVKQDGNANERSLRPHQRPLPENFHAALHRTAVARARGGGSHA